MSRADRHDLHVQIPKQVYDQAKRRAILQGKTMRVLITELLQRYVKDHL